MAGVIAAVRFPVPDDDPPTALVLTAPAIGYVLHSEKIDETTQSSTGQGKRLYGIDMGDRMNAPLRFLPLANKHPQGLNSARRSVGNSRLLIGLHDCWGHD